MCTDAEDIVLDPFIGRYSTTVVAANQLGRQFIGIEVDADCVEIARRKIEQTTETGKVGDVWVSMNNGEIVYPLIKGMGLLDLFCLFYI